MLRVESIVLRMATRLGPRVVRRAERKDACTCG